MLRYDNGKSTLNDNQRVTCLLKVAETEEERKRKTEYIHVETEREVRNR